ncbi:DNA cytosine methyltransferase, partial [Bacteroidota bacterium]
MKSTKIYWIDLFCGAGGTSTGIHLSESNAEVIACVNHDYDAIEAHKQNHPECLHFAEDIRDFKVVERLNILVNKLRKKNPDCVINIWASLECTNYSKAKGGLPRDGDSRTLANHLFMYLEHLNPDYLYIENVREFMAWGPLDKNGKPLSRDKGRDYMRWVNKVKSFGFIHESKMLNAADFGAYQSRERYFGIFAKKGFPISFPTPTYYNPKKRKNTSPGLFEFTKKPWKAVREILNLENKGVSIFERKKELSENTLKRIYAGLLKFVAGGESEFIKRYNGGNPSEKVKSLNQPIGTISTNGRHAIVSTAFLKKYYSGRPEGKVIGLDGPAGTVTTVGGQALVQSEFLTSYYGNGQPHDTRLPCPTVTTKDRFALNYLQYDYSNPTFSAIDQPAGTITTTPKHNLVTNEWLTDTQFGRVGQSLDQPCFTLIARMDKKPPYVISTKEFEYKRELNLSKFLNDQDKEF